MRTMTIALVALAVSAVAGSAMAADPVNGEWLTPSGKARVRIQPCAGHADQLCGTIVWMRDPARDENNPNVALRSRAIVGLPFLTHFRREGPGRWSGGSIYNPQDGKTYDSKMQIRPGGSLGVSGCVLVFCQTQVWSRAP